MCVWEQRVLFNHRWKIRGHEPLQWNGLWHPEMVVNMQWTGLNWTVLLPSIRPFWFRSGTPSLWRPTPESRRRSSPSTSCRLLGTWRGWSINCMTLATEASPHKRYCILYYTTYTAYLTVYLYSWFSKSAIEWKPEDFLRQTDKHITQNKQARFGTCSLTEQFQLKIHLLVFKWAFNVIKWPASVDRVCAVPWRRICWPKR